MSRLLLLAVTVLGLLSALEVLCRAQPEGLAAVAHRVRFKLALLHAKGPVDFVSLGSSRSNDGINPALLGLGHGFSAATPSTSLPTLEFQAAQLGPQKLVFVELSGPQALEGTAVGGQRRVKLVDRALQVARDEGEYGLVEIDPAEPRTVDRQRQRHFACF